LQNIKAHLTKIWHNKLV